MIRVTLLKPDGRVHRGRVCKPGDVLDLDAADAAEVLRAEDGFLHPRMRVKRGLLLAGAWYAADAVVDLHPDYATSSTFAAYLELVPLAALVDVQTEGGAVRRGATFKASPALAVDLIGRGAADWSVDLDGSPTAKPAAPAAATGSKGGKR